MMLPSADKTENVRLNHVHTSQGRVGFTLVEVLIALSLTVLLLSAIYSAIDMHIRFQTAGRAEIHRAQLMRAVIRKMDEDFSGIVLVVAQEDEEDESSGGVESQVPTTSISDTALTVGGLESEGTPITFGVVGTSDIMHLCVSRPLRDLSYDSLYTDSPTSGRSNDLLTVTYGVGPVDINLLFDPRQPKYADRDSSQFTSRPLTGFARRSIDLYAFDAATDTLETEHVLAPEITEVRFAYFDGTVWLDAWDSREIGGLPRAVRVTFGLWQPPSKKESKGLQYQGGGVTASIEHTFHIPLAVPLIE